MRRPSLVAFALMSATALSSLTVVASVAAMAQSSPAPSPAPSTAPSNAPSGAVAAPAESAPSPDTVIAKVGSDEIHYADLQEAMTQIPEQLRQLPPGMLYPMLLDQLVDRQVIVEQAVKDGLQNDPKVKAAVQRASNAALQNALLSRDIQPMLTPEAIQARYDKEYAGKPGEEEVRAEHILVPTEAKANEVIADLKKGADFGDLAKANSVDPSAKQNNGELGWFKKADMLPEFSDAAFALKPGEITQSPVQTRFGWHVIKLEERRQAPPPTLDEVRDQIRQEIIQEGVTKVLASARQGVTIQKFNPDGTPMVDAPAAATPAPAK